MNRTSRRPRRLLVALVGALTVALTAACGHQLVADPPAATDATVASTTPSAAPTPSSAPSAPDPSTSAPGTPDPGTPDPSTSAPSTSATTKPSGKPSTSKPLLAPGDSGEKVRELQHRLLQIAWYEGRITGTFDKPTVTAVKGFQVKRGYRATGQVDQRTWDKLVAMTRMPTHDEMYNVLKPGKAILKAGSTGDQVRELQARLKQIGWFSEKVTGFYGEVTTASVKGFQGKRGFPVTGEVDQRTWDRLVQMTHEPTQEEMANEPPKTSTNAAGLDERCLTGARVLCVSFSTRKLVYLTDGKVQLVMDARFGSASDPTRTGVFHVFRKVKDDWSRPYNSPMPFAMYFSGGEAVHYSYDFAARGWNGASHGCVNIRDWDGLEWLFGQIRIGDKVVVYP